MPPREVTQTPTLAELYQNILTTAESARKAEEVNKPGLLDKFTGTISKGFAEAAEFGFKDVLGTGLEILDYPRQYVSKPLLGAVAASVEGRWGEVGGINDLRRIWDETNLPGFVKFTAELGTDPTVLLGGWGFFRGVGTKVALRMANQARAARGLGLGVGGRLKAATLAAKLEGEPAMLELGRLAARGEAIPHNLARGVGDAIARHGKLPTEFVDDFAGNLAAVTGDELVDVAKMLQPNVMARRLPWLARAMAPVELGFEALWNVPFSMATPLVVPAAKPIAGAFKLGMDSFGKFRLVRGAVRMMAAHSQTFSDLDAYMRGGRPLSAFFALPTPQSVAMGADRATRRTFAHLKEVEARNIGEEFNVGNVLSRAYRSLQGDEALDPALAAVLGGPDSATSQSLTTALSGAKADEFEKLIANAVPDEGRLVTGFRDLLARGVKRELAPRGYVEGAEVMARGPLGAFFGAGAAAINVMRPAVLARPDFAVIETLSNYMRGGTIFGRMSHGQVDLLTELTGMNSLRVAKKGVVPTLRRAVFNPFKSPQDLARLEELRAAQVLGEASARAAGLPAKPIRGARALARQMEQADLLGTLPDDLVPVIGQFEAAPDGTLTLPTGLPKFVRNYIQNYRTRMAATDATGFASRISDGMYEHAMDVLLSGRGGFVNRERALASELMQALKGLDVHPNVYPEMERLTTRLLAGDKSAYGEALEILDVDTLELVQYFGGEALGMPRIWRLKMQADVAASVESGMPAHLALMKAQEQNTALAYRAAGEHLASVNTYIKDIWGNYADMAAATGWKHTASVAKAEVDSFRVGAKMVKALDADYALGGYGAKALAARRVPFELTSKAIDVQFASSLSQSVREVPGRTSAQYIPIYEGVKADLAARTDKWLRKGVKYVTEYGDAVKAGKSKEARAALSKLGRLFPGDFKAVATNAEELPTVSDLARRYVDVVHNTWTTRYPAAKILVADEIVQKAGTVPRDIPLTATKGTLEEVRTLEGELTRIKHLLGQELEGQEIMGIASETLPALREQEKVLTTKINHLLAPTGRLDEAGVARLLDRTFQEVKKGDRLMTLRQKAAGRMARDYDLPVNILPALDALQSSYGELAAGYMKQFDNLMPANARQMISRRLTNMRNMVGMFEKNKDYNVRAVETLRRFMDKANLIGSDEAMQLEIKGLLREGAVGRGLDNARRWFVDYTTQNNVDRLFGFFSLFPVWGLRLPAYVGRNFVNRPGWVMLMNHLANSEAFNRQGIPMMGGFFLAPHMRMDYLPILARKGESYVYEGDHPVNQGIQFLQAFGFYPGPQAQVTLDAAGEFLNQTGLTQREVDPEVVFGFLPQFRWVRDITAMTGFNDSKGLHVPFLSGSTNPIDRAVERELASRVASRVTAEEEKLGRSLYQDEVAELRDSVHRNELEAARRAVAGRDLALGFVPGLQFTSEDEQGVINHVRDILETKGVKVGDKRGDVIRAYFDQPSMERLRIQNLVPAFKDFLYLTPFTESGKERAIRQARGRYFRSVDKIWSDVSRQQRILDNQLDSGELLPQDWRDARGDLRTRAVAGVEALKSDPEIQAALARAARSDDSPEEMAYREYLSIEPVDADGDGRVGTADWKSFFEAREAFMERQPGWLKEYVIQRRQFNMTPTEIEFESARELINGYYDIPKYPGLNAEQSERADAVLRRARTYARVSNLPVEQIVLSAPGIEQEDRVLALSALMAGTSPSRWQYWASHPILNRWYPDIAPGTPE